VFSGGGEGLGVFVTFEGIEGAGKSTLVAGVAERLRAGGERVVVTKEPGGTEFGEAVRAVFLDPAFSVDPVAEVMLINASRAQLVAKVIAPALKTGAVVLCDRFYDSTIAYQGFGRGLDGEELLQICLAATHRISPDLTILVDIPVEVSAARVRARGGKDRLELEDAAFHTRVRDGYLALAARFHQRYVTLDGVKDSALLVREAAAIVEARRTERQ
jgi:dTMP kinase